MTSYSIFSLGAAARPLAVLDRWFHPYQHNGKVDLHGYSVTVYWTTRANQALLARTRPLVIEAQLYFSCVIKKRVLFHDATTESDIPVHNLLRLRFRLVEASSCDPLEFARYYPEQKELHPVSVDNIRPKEIRFDWIKGDWYGEFEL